VKICLVFQVTLLIYSENESNLDNSSEGKTKEEKIFGMSFAKVYPLLVAKAEKKGRTKAELDEVTCRLTGHSIEKLDELMKSDITYGDFFLKVPNLNPDRKLITGTICGVRVENIENPLMLCRKSDIWINWLMNSQREKHWKKLFANQNKVLYFQKI